MAEQGAPVAPVPSGAPAGRRLRVLAIVANFKWVHLDYLHALAERVDLTVWWSGSPAPRAVDQAIGEGLRVERLGRIGEESPRRVRRRVAALLKAIRPDLVHVLYYRHEELVLLAREVAGDAMPIVCEIRDPLTTSTTVPPGDPWWELEGNALRASDAQIFVSRALRAYLEHAHGVDFGASSIIVPQAFALRDVAPPAEKLSARDGRTHIALVGTADLEPDEGRWYGGIIRRLVDQGLVVHTRFHELPGRSLDVYRELAAELADYHFEPQIPMRRDPYLSTAISQYDVMGVFHELEAPRHNESATLAVCLPTKAVSGWFHGAIPAVCTPHYRGVVERIEGHGIGFVAESVDHVGRAVADRRAIEGARAACLAVRETFSQQHQAARIERLYRSLVAR